MSCMAARTAFLEVRVFPLGVRNNGFSRSDQNTILIKMIPIIMSKFKVRRIIG